MEDGVRLLKVKEAAAWLRMGKKRIYAMINNGELRYVPGGGNRKLVPVTEIDRWVAEHTVCATGLAEIAEGAEA